MKSSIRTRTGLLTQTAQRAGLPAPSKEASPPTVFFADDPSNSNRAAPPD